MFLEPCLTTFDESVRIESRGRPCIFPFKFNEKDSYNATYTKCTREGSSEDGRYYCPTVTRFIFENGDYYSFAHPFYYGFCNPDCPTE